MGERKVWKLERYLRAFSIASASEICRLHLDVLERRIIALPEAGPMAAGTSTRIGMVASDRPGVLLCVFYRADPDEIWFGDIGWYDQLTGEVTFISS